MWKITAQQIKVFDGLVRWRTCTVVPKPKENKIEYGDGVLVFTFFNVHIDGLCIFLKTG